MRVCTCICIMRAQVQKMEYEDVKETPADGIYVHGLYLEGCSWSKKEAHMIEAARGELVRPPPPPPARPRPAAAACGAPGGGRGRGGRGVLTAVRLFRARVGD